MKEISVKAWNSFIMHTDAKQLWKTVSGKHINTFNYSAFYVEHWHNINYITWLWNRNYLQTVDSNGLKQGRNDGGKV